MNILDKLNRVLKEDGEYADLERIADNLDEEKTSEGFAKHLKLALSELEREMADTSEPSKGQLNILSGQLEAILEKYTRISKS